MKRTIALLLLLFLCSSLLVFAQGNVAERDSQQAVLSGSTLKFNDAHGTLTQSFEVLLTGTAPATLTISISGCMRGGTCNTTPVATSTGTANQLLVPVNPALYDYYSASVAWTGGDATTRVTINRTGTVAKSGGGQVPFNNVTAGNNTAILTVGGAGSLSPLTTTAAQIVGNQLWTQFGLSAPIVTATLTGGNILPADSIRIAYTLNTALGETLPSITTSGAANTFSAGACASGTACTVSLAPTVPTGYTGFTAYFCDNNGTGCGTTLQRVLTCTNITGTCTIANRSLASGVNLPTSNTAIIQPPNLQTSNCPTGMLPSLFVQTSDGNWWPQGGIDPQSYSGTPQTPDGTFTFCRRFYFNDTQGAQTFKNAGVSFAHLAGTGTNAAVQDRTLGLDLATPANDSATRWGIEVLQAELDLICNGCNYNGSPDGEEVVFSGQMSDTAATNYTPGTLGPAVARFQYFKSGAGQTSGNTMRVVNGIFSLNNVAAVTNGTEAQIYEANCQNTSASLNMDCVALNLDLPGIRHNNGTGAVQIQNTGAAIGGTSPNSQDFVIKNYKHGLVSWLNGTMGLTGIDNTDAQALPVNASLHVTGSITTNQVATSWGSGYTGGCSGGASTYTYQLVAVDDLGGRSPSASFNVNSCVNPLTGVNPITLSPGAGGPSTLTGLPYRQAKSIDVERTGGPMGLGKVGTLTCNTNIPILGCSAFTDTGIVATGTVTTINTFGGLGNAGDDNFTTGKGQHKNTQAANNDYAGVATCVASTVTVTFTRAYISTPVILLSDETTAGGARVSAKSASSFTITCTGATDVVDYATIGNPN